VDKWKGTDGGREAEERIIREEIVSPTANPTGD
jgi:hypothetical protein